MALVEAKFRLKKITLKMNDEFKFKTLLTVM